MQLCLEVMYFLGEVKAKLITFQNKPEYHVPVHVSVIMICVENIITVCWVSYGGSIGYKMTPRNNGRTQTKQE